MSGMAMLGEAALRGILLAAAGGLVACRLRHALQRLYLWRFVLYAALAMPLLMLATPRIRVPVFARTPAAATAAIVAPDITPAMAPIPRQFPSPAPAPAPRRRSIPWVELGYSAVAAFLLLRLALGMAWAARLRRQARPIEASGCDFPVAESDAAAVPGVVGVLRPTIVLPSDWRDWPAATLPAVLRHEAAHARRRDGLTQRLALAYRALFWFSPLGWWLAAQLAGLAEEASDGEVLAAGVEPAAYAELLLRFIQRAGSAPRVRWENVSMANARSERRLERVLQWKGEPMVNAKRLTWRLAVVAIPAALAMAAVYPVAARQTPPQAKRAATVTAPATPPAAAPAAAPAAISKAPGSAAAQPVGGFQYSLIMPPVSDAAGSCGYQSYDGIAAIAIGDNCSTFGGLLNPTDRGFQFLVTPIAVEFNDGGKSYRVTEAGFVHDARAQFAALDDNNAKQAYLDEMRLELRSQTSQEQEQLASQAEKKRGMQQAIDGQINELEAQLSALAPANPAQQLMAIHGRVAEIQRQIAYLRQEEARNSEQSDTSRTDLSSQNDELRQRGLELQKQQDELGIEASSLVRNLERSLRESAAYAREKGLAHELPK